MTGVLTAAVFAQQSTQDQLAARLALAERQDQLTEGAMTADLAGRLPGLGGSEAARIARGFRIAPVRLDLARKDPLLVGLGSYLVNATGGCNDCHTAPSYAAGGNPFRGEPKRINAEHYLAGGASFGPVVSRNLTPDPAGLPAALTYEQFALEIRTGIDLKKVHPEISPLLQVMPWPVYQDLTDRDLRAIYEYLRAIPHAEPVPPATQ